MIISTTTAKLKYNPALGNIWTNFFDPFAEFVPI